ncbi:MAG: hypothetical protein KJ709_05415 [Nanoarchaeota archaeon]|nr:hypothetical protein [Nanoarchaeota archaeon]
MSSETEDIGEKVKAILKRVVGDMAIGKEPKFFGKPLFDDTGRVCLVNVDYFELGEYWKRLMLVDVEVGNVYNVDDVVRTERNWLKLERYDLKDVFLEGDTAIVEYDILTGIPWVRLGRRDHKEREIDLQDQGDDHVIYQYVKEVDRTQPLFKKKDFGENRPRCV